MKKRLRISLFVQKNDPKKRLRVRLNVREKKLILADKGPNGSCTHHASVWESQRHRRPCRSGVGLVWKSLVWLDNENDPKMGLFGNSTR